MAVTTYRDTTFRQGDKVKIIADWIENKPTAIICGFQVNSGVRFARVKWMGKGSLADEYGTLFTLDELKKV